MTDLVRPAWVELAPAAKTLTQDIYKTEFVPAALRGNGPAVLACVMAGAEIGLGPMTSLQLIDVIQGRPALSPEGQRALVLRAGHRIVPREMSATACTVWGQRADTGDELTVTWTMDEAAQAGLASKTNWRQYPKAMLLARATSELCRGLFADVISGIGSYVPDELGHDGGAQPAAVDAGGDSEWDQAVPAAPADEPIDAVIVDVPPVVSPEEHPAVPDERIPRSVAQRLVKRLEHLDPEHADRIRELWAENRWPAHPDGRLRPTLLTEAQHRTATVLLDTWEQEPTIDELPEAQWPDPATTDPTAAALETLAEGGVVDDA